MSHISVSAKYVAIVKNLQIDCYDYSNHTIVDVPSPAKPQENDHLTNVIVSADSKYLAAVTSSSKQLIVFNLPALTDPKIYSLPRGVSKIRFTIKNSHILVADKTGDVLIYDLNKEDNGSKLLGHLSLLLDILQTNDEKYLITSDRDEKIRVSCYPNTYNIQTYCLGHKEFVNHIELLPHNDKYLISSSGDGDVRFWDYVNGNTCYSINTNNDVSDHKLKDNFAKKMDEEKIEVETLPIVHLAVTKLNEDISLVAITVHSYNNILIYSIRSSDSKFSHKLETKIQVDNFPTDLQLYNLNLFIYNDLSSNVTSYIISFSNDIVTVEKKITEKVFASNISNGQYHKIENHFESIKVLFKRKYDNVQEYQERKKQRLEKSLKTCDVNA